MNSSDIRLTVLKVADSRIEARSHDGTGFSLPAEILSVTPDVGDHIRLSAVLEKAQTDDSHLFKQRLNELFAPPAL